MKMNTKALGTKLTCSCALSLDWIPLFFRCRCSWCVNFSSLKTLLYCLLCFHLSKHARYQQTRRLLHKQAQLTKLSTQSHLLRFFFFFLVFLTSALICAATTDNCSPSTSCRIFPNSLQICDLNWFDQDKRYYFAQN